MQHRLRLCDALPESEVGAGSPSRLVGSGGDWPGAVPASPARLGGARGAPLRLRHVEDPGGLDVADLGVAVATHDRSHNRDAILTLAAHTAGFQPGGEA